MRAMRSLASRGDVSHKAVELCSTRRGQVASRFNGWCASPAYSGRKSTGICSVSKSAREQSTTPIVTLRIPYRVQFGEVLRVVGSGSQLGDWSADRGLQLTWSEGDVWIAELPFSAGHYEFKCVVYNTQTNSVTRWEDGGNRILNITEELGAWDVSCQWGATADMVQAFTPKPSPAPLAPEPADAVLELASAAEEPTESPEPAAEESLPSFMVLEGAGGERVQEQEALEEVAPVVAAAPAAATAAASAGVSEEAAPDSGPGGAGGAVMLLLATCAAGAVAAFALLTPGGLDKFSLGASASQAVNATMLRSSEAGAQVKAQVQSQLAALADHVTAVQAQVSAVQPAVSAQISSVTDTVADGLSSLQPMVRSGVAFMQSQETAVQSKAVMVVAEASTPIVRQG